MAVKCEKDVTPMSEMLKKVKQKQFEEILRHEEGREDDERIG